MVGQVKVGRVRSTGHDVSVLVDDKITVLLPRHGSVTCDVQGASFRASKGEALILSPNPRQTRVEAPRGERFEAIPLLFSVKDIQQKTEELGGSISTKKRLTNFGMALSFDQSPLGNQFSRLADVLVSELEIESLNLSKKSAQSWSHLLTEKLVTVLANSSVIALPEDDGAGTAYRHVFRAEDYMHEHFADISTVADIANACGISVRSLEMAFKSVRSRSPIAALAGIRLSQARGMLCTGGNAESVTQVAFDCGFNHLGRFAIAYKRQFGESPSETMRKR